MSIKPEASWSKAANWVFEQIDESWRGLENRKANSRFITRDRLCQIWEEEFSVVKDETPFSLLCKFSDSDLELAEFEEKAIQLTSALIYIQWAGLVGESPRYQLDSEGLRIVLDDEVKHLQDSELPIKDERYLNALFEDDQRAKREFRDQQYAFVPLYIITGSKDYQECGQSIRLPFEDRDHQKRGGFYGQVEKICIAPGGMGPANKRYSRHGGGRYDEGEIFACKNVKPPRIHFLNEYDKLVKIFANRSHHDHIVVHLAAIVNEEELGFKILFDWAWSDLNHFLGKQPGDYPDWLKVENITLENLIDQVHHLGEALDFLHSSIGDADRIPLFHMDFKPENILVFEPSQDQAEDHPLGLWKITDFGVSDFGTSSSDAGVRLKSIGEMILANISEKDDVSKPMRQEGSYQGPEAEDQSGQLDQAKADVWSYGCVATEILAYAMGGAQGVEDLRAVLRRKKADPDDHWRSGYFYVGCIDGTYKLHPDLSKFFSNQDYEHHQKPDELESLWGLIKRHALAIDPIKRSTARRCYHQMRVQNYASGNSAFEEDQSLSQNSTRESYDQRLTPSPVSDEMDVSEDNDSDKDNENGNMPLKQTRVRIAEDNANVSMNMPTQRKLRPSPDRRESETSLSTSIYSSNGSRSPQSRKITPSKKSRLSFKSLFKPKTSEPNLPLTPSSTNEAVTSSTSDTKLRRSTDLKIHLKEIGFTPTFVVPSTDGEHILLCSEKRLAWSKLSKELLFNSVTILDRETRSPVSMSSVKISGSTAMIKDDNRHVSMHNLDGWGIDLAQKNLNLLTEEAEIKLFNVSTSHYFVLEFADSVKVFGPRSDPDHSSENGSRASNTWHCSLSYPKGSQDFVDLVFDISGKYLYAITREYFYVWKKEDSTPLRQGKHCLREDMALSLRIFPINESPDFILQDLERLHNIYLIDEHKTHDLKLRCEDWTISSQICITADNGSICCIGSQKGKKSVLHWQLEPAETGVDIGPLEVTPLNDRLSSNFGMSVSQRETKNVVNVLDKSGVQFYLSLST